MAKARLHSTMAAPHTPGWRRWIIILILLLLLLLLIVSLGRCRQVGAGRNGNLLFNGDAESGEGSPDGQKIMAPPGWKGTGQFNVVRYGATNGYPALDVVGPANRGRNFFAGGPDGNISSAMQEVDVSSDASAIDAGKEATVLSGWLGGYQSQSDSAMVGAEFVNAQGGVISMLTLGPVLAAERNSTTCFMEKTTRGPVPAGTRRIRVTITMRRTEGTSNDGYADNLSLTLVPAK